VGSKMYGGIQMFDISPGMSSTVIPDLVEINATVWKCIKEKQTRFIDIIDVA
jgi:hypothetical protein